MRFSRISFIILGLFIFINLYSYCRWAGPYIKPANTLDSGLKYSDIVFLGELIYTDSVKYYKFRIFEVFKGSYKLDTINGIKHDECSIVPDFKGLWIIYAKFSKDSSIDIMPIGSRCMKYNSYVGGPPPPPPKMFYYKDSKSGKIIPSEIKEEPFEEYRIGLMTWFNDLEKLRYYKSHSQNIKVVKVIPKINYELTLLILSTIINLSLFIVLLYKFKASRKY